MSLYYAITLDPLHVGTGGYRMGRVDNTIVRDAALGLPKVPGSSLAGVVRSYAALALKDEEDQKAALDCAREKSAARGNCGECKVCRIFGHAVSSKTNSSRIGLLRFYDGQIVAFPVRTLCGPVWVASPLSLRPTGVDLHKLPGGEKLLATSVQIGSDKVDRLNLGWLYLPVEKIEGEDTKQLQPVLDQLNRIMPGADMALAPDWLFAEIVNSNLEVRTSVSIDDKTGASEGGKLFTSESIPAATLLAFDIALDKARLDQSGMTENEVRDVLNAALKQCALLGMGGMVTRGFGRLSFRREGD